ncbi:serine/threonine-protein kinase [Mycolicibacterium sp.]|uniref:serine/threonine-protein kinase n=1 Tax=Mycolicibacterium sp. TaxID=2320850 RepID=UPI0037C6EBEB
MPLTDGEEFAGYTIVRRLGSGGMGEVYLAQHPRLPRQDALKILPAQLTQDDAYRQRFHREAELAATLWNPHVVGVHDRGEHNGQLWISMDFVDGTDAAKLLSTNGTPGLPVGQVLDIADAVADALDFAHHHGLLHRDVKPANILLATPPTGRQRILLADFGIARHTEDVHGLTETNTTLGTVSYAAPEQLLGQPLTPAADQYALAATIYTLLAGGPPFVDSNPAVVIGKHLNTPPPPVPPALASFNPVLARALAKAPADRFATCTAFAQALRAASAGPATVYSTYIPPQPWNPGPQIASPRPRWPAIVVPAILAILTLVAGAAGALIMNSHRETAPATPNWQPYVDAASQFAVDLTSIDYRTIDRDIQKILDNSTGDFHRDFTDRRESFAEVTRQAQSQSTGTVTGAGLESVSGDQATTLVAVTVKTTTGPTSEPSPRNWRMRITMARTGSDYKATNVEFVS